MSDLIVNGGRPLSGTITPSGNKNSVLPILCATLLTDEPVTLTNVPDITDLDKLVAFLRAQGSRIDWDRGRRPAGRPLGIPAVALRRRTAAGHALDRPPLPALLRRLGRIAVRSNAKGCSLGVREIDPHLDVLRALGAAVGEGDPLTIDLPGDSGASGTGSTTCR